MGCSIVTNGNPSALSTCAMISAALTNFSVMIDTEGSPRRSPVTESCRLHDEQLPQSPIPEINAFHLDVASIRSVSAGAL